MRRAERPTDTSKATRYAKYEWATSFRLTQDDKALFREVAAALAAKHGFVDKIDVLRYAMHLAAQRHGIASPYGA